MYRQRLQHSTDSSVEKNPEDGGCGSELRAISCASHLGEVVRIFAFAALAAVPSSRFGLPRRVASPGVVASAVARLPHLGVVGSGIPTLAARLSLRSQAIFSLGGLPSVEARASSDVWGPALPRASLRRCTRVRLPRRRCCFGSGAMRGTLLRQRVVAGDVEVRSLLRTRASPSRLFLRMRRSRRSSACTASSRPRPRPWPSWSVCEEGACCSARAFVCVSARPRSVQQRWSADVDFGLHLAAIPRASVQLVPCLVHSRSRTVASATRVRFGARAH